MKSIGMKVYVALGIIGVLFLVIVFMNISGLGIIGGFNNDLGEVYIELEMAAGDTDNAYQETQLYANLAFIKRNTDQKDSLASDLEKSIENVRTYMAQAQNLNAATGNQELLNAYTAYEDKMNVFLDYSQTIYDSLMAKDYDIAQQLVNEVITYRTPVQEAEAAYDEVLKSSVAEAVRRSETQISGTVIFNYIAIALYVIILVITVLIVARTIVKPARASGNALRSITDKLDAGEGDLTERVPAKTKDEVGQMAVGINSFITQLQKIMQ